MGSPKRHRSASTGANDFTVPPPASAPPPSYTPSSTPKSSPYKPTTKSNGVTPGSAGANLNQLVEKPIRYYDAEVQRMHDELERTDKSLTRQSTSYSSKRSQGITIKGFFFRVVVVYVLYAYFFACPSDPKRTRSICRSLDSFSSTLKSYEPHVRPYYTQLQSSASPYLSRAHSKLSPYIDIVHPYYVKTESIVTPLSKSAYKGYKTHVKPTIVKALVWSQTQTEPYMDKLRGVYKTSLAPSVEWYGNAGKKWFESNLEPHTSLVLEKGKLYGAKLYETVSPVYYVGLPWAHKHYHHTLLPFAKTTSKTTKETYQSQVHPRLVVAYHHSNGFFRSKILPSLQRFYSLYILPQVEKIREKIFEYRSKLEESESVRNVEVAEEQIAKEIGVDDLEDFISELRDTTYTSGGDSTTEPIPATEHQPTPEEKAASTAEKRAALESLSTVYEKEIARLGASEQELLLSRLYEIRSSAAEDIPKRFTKLLTSLDEEGDKMIGKLGKYFNKYLSGGQSGGEGIEGVEEKVKDADFLEMKAVAKVRKLAGELLMEMGHYREALVAKEVAAVQHAESAVNTLVGKAQEELGFGWTWLDDVRASDWSRFHQLGKAETNWRSYYHGVQSGAIKDPSLLEFDPESQIEAIVKEVNDTVSTFEKVLSKIKVKGQRELKGEWTGLNNEAAKAFEKAGEIVGELKKSAGSLVGVTEPEPTPTNVQESASSIYAAAHSSATSLLSSAYEALPTVPPVPTDYVVDSYNSATENVVAAVESIASVADSAAQAIVTEVPQFVENVISMASSLGEQAQLGFGEGASLLVAGVTDVASKVTELGVPTITAAPEKIQEIWEDVKSGAESVYGEASQTIVRAAGGEPEPTNLKQSVTSLANVVAAKASSIAAHVEL